MITGAVGIYAEEAFAFRSDGTAIGVDVALATTDAGVDGLKIRDGFGGGFGGPTSDVVEPGANHFVAFFDPALVRDGTGMGVGGRGADVLNRDFGGFANRFADLVGALVGEDLDIEIEMEGSGFAVGEGEGGDPEVQVNAFGLFMFLCAPTAVSDVGRRVGAAAADASEDLVVSWFHLKTGHQGC